MFNFFSLSCYISSIVDTVRKMKYPGLTSKETKINKYKKKGNCSTGYNNNN